MLVAAPRARWRDGKVVHDHCTGVRRGDDTPNLPDTIFRLYSMTKPVVAVALMTLFDEGRFSLGDPLHLHLGPSWKKGNMTVYVSGPASNPATVPCERTITVKHLLTHTSGLSYGFDYLGYVDFPPPPSSD